MLMRSQAPLSEVEASQAGVRDGIMSLLHQLPPSVFSLLQFIVRTLGASSPCHFSATFNVEPLSAFDRRTVHVMLAPLLHDVKVTVTGKKAATMRGMRIAFREHVVAHHTASATGGVASSTRS